MYLPNIKDNNSLTPTKKTKYKMNAQNIKAFSTKKQLV